MTRTMTLKHGCRHDLDLCRLVCFAADIQGFTPDEAIRAFNERFKADVKFYYNTLPEDCGDYMGIFPRRDGSCDNVWRIAHKGDLIEIYPDGTINDGTIDDDLFGSRR
ncbi:MAG: hypothetical protein Q8K86_08200 [Candidatus Nanopelagicaceae bacterium]|nr:hypothetical protein [Candidatus Nanopelagicaceae bacterium]